MLQVLLRSRLIGRAFDVMDREQVDMTEDAVAELDESIQIFLGVINALNKQVFERDTPVGLLNVVNKRNL